MVDNKNKNQGRHLIQQEHFTRQTKYGLGGAFMTFDPGAFLKAITVVLAMTGYDFVFRPDKNNSNPVSTTVGNSTDLVSLNNVNSSNLIDRPNVSYLSFDLEEGISVNGENGENFRYLTENEASGNLV